MNRLRYGGRGGGGVGRRLIKIKEVRRQFSLDKFSILSNLKGGENNTVLAKEFAIAPSSAEKLI